MSSKDHRSITYIYNEMDPSEVIEFERELENNSDLLIEVESLKTVKDQLHGLEQFNPPKDLVNSICQMAGNRGSSEQASTGRTVFYAVAAMLLLGMTSGVWLFDINLTDGGINQSATSQFASPSISQSPGSASSLDAKSWVDQNDIIYLNIGQNSSNQAEIDSMMMNSLKKLTPVKNSVQARSLQNRLQLTGTQ